jgi:hypothetical protein
MVRTIKNIKIDQVPNKPEVEIETDHGNRYIISRSKIINKIAIK